MSHASHLPTSSHHGTGEPSRREQAALAIPFHPVRRKSAPRKLLDLLCFPLRAFVLNEPAQKRLGLTTLKEERVGMVLRHARGTLLDVGCGNNELVRHHGAGLGGDIYRWQGVDVQLEGHRLPFRSASFDTVSFVANLNHIPKSARAPALAEAGRVLRPEGRLLVTMISPFVGYWVHKLTWWDPDLHDRGMEEEEDPGLSRSYLLALFQQAGFRLAGEDRCVYGLNCLYILEPAPSTQGLDRTAS